MAKLIPVGISINGRRRRFTIMPGGRYLYSCPNCTGLVSNDQSYCEYRRPAVREGGGVNNRPHSSLRSGHLRGAASSLLDPVSHHERASLTWGGAEADVVPER